MDTSYLKIMEKIIEANIRKLLLGDFFENPELYEIDYIAEEVATSILEDLKNYVVEDIFLDETIGFVVDDIIDEKLEDIIIEDKLLMEEEELISVESFYKMLGFNENNKE